MIVRAVFNMLKPYSMIVCLFVRLFVCLFAFLFADITDIQGVLTNNQSTSRNFDSSALLR